jgi:hypothetical protein
MTERFTAPISGLYHLPISDTPHLASECTDTCQTVGGPFTALPGTYQQITLDSDPRPEPRAHQYVVGGLPHDPTPEQLAAIASGDWPIRQPDDARREAADDD